MNVTNFFIIIGFLAVIYILIDIRKGKLSILDSMIWIFGCIIIIILSIFPNMIVYFANLVGIEYPPSLLFLLAIIVLLGMNFKQAKKISKQEEKIIDLAQNFAILKDETKK
ncbi:MAG: DUF2304 domain-containing protein [Clostridia bacterium]